MCVALLVKIPTNCKIDEVLEGGFSQGEISLIYGEAETAKTTLAMQCAVNCARLGYKTLFVDCDGTFSPRRLAQIASKDFDKARELIILARPKDFKEQAIVIDQIIGHISKSFCLIILDTFTSLYRMEISEKPEKAFELNRELNRQMAWLAQFAKTQKIAVIVTSQVRSVFEEAFWEVEPVATRVLKFWSNVIVAMKPTEDSKVIRVVLMKRGEVNRPFLCHLKIEEDGLHDFTP
jgi:DNA repair and recombination protein RadB